MEVLRAALRTTSIKRTDYNPGAALGDSLVLGEMWGYSVLFSAGTAAFDIDNVTVTGFAPPVEFDPAPGRLRGLCRFLLDGSSSTPSPGAIPVDAPTTPLRRWWMIRRCTCRPPIWRRRGNWGDAPALPA